MKKLAVCLKEKASIERLNDQYVKTVIIPGLFSAPQGITAEKENELIKAAGDRNFDIYVRIDRLYGEKELDQLEAYLGTLKEKGVKGVFFSDLAIMTLIKKSGSLLENVYAPETLLTCLQEIEEFKKQGFDNCVISKELTLKEILEIAHKLPDYCWTRVHGPLLLAVSRRHYISSYLQKEDDYSQGYSLQEETREAKMPLVETAYGSWLYGPVLSSYESIKELYASPLSHLIIDGAWQKDEEVLTAVENYTDILNGQDPADYKSAGISINEIRETALLKENHEA